MVYQWFSLVFSPTSRGGDAIAEKSGLQVRGTAWGSGVMEGWGKIRKPKNEIRNGIEPPRYRPRKGFGVGSGHEGRGTTEILRQAQDDKIGGERGDLRSGYVRGPDVEIGAGRETGAQRRLSGCVHGSGWAHLDTAAIMAA
jgi:hypothetical protein